MTLPKHVRRKVAKGRNGHHRLMNTREFVLYRMATEVLRRDNGCLIWQGSKTSVGYGDVRLDGRSQLVHRIAYENAKGPIPDGLYIDHLCRQRDCINPEHLETVTHAENLRRARKSECIRGHALTDDNVYVSPGKGLRQCRKCSRLRAVARWERRRGQAS